MSCAEHAEFEDRLHDYAGGYLSGRDRQEVDEHILICAECRDELRGLQALLTEIAALPRSVEAPPEIWQATSESIRSRRSEPVPLAGRRGGSRVQPRPMVWMPLAVAAAALIVAALAIYVSFSQPAPGAITAEGGRGGVDANVADHGAGAGGAIVQAGEPALGQTEAEFGRAADELLAALEARRDELPPRTLAVIEESLKAINKAIAETHEAMESDPGNAKLGGLMRAMYRRKMTLLNGASEIPAI